MLRLSQSLVQQGQGRVSVDTETYLHGIRDKILTSHVHFHYDWMSNPHQFLDGFWNNISSDPQVPVFIVIADLFAGQMGNRMGNFLQYVACGLLAGAHVVIVDFNRHYDLHDHEDELPSTNNNKRYGVHFFDAIPVVLMNPHPASDQATSRIAYRTKCGTGIANPWEYSFPVEEMIPYYRQIILPAIDAQMNALIDLYELSSTLILPSATEFEEFQNVRKNRPHSTTEKFHKVIDTPDLNVVMDAMTRDYLPFYPHVTIHWRCSDNVFFDFMGLTPYHFILSRLPKWATYVYIVTDTSYGDGKHTASSHTLHLLIHPATPLLMHTSNTSSHIPLLGNNYPDPNRKSRYSGLCIPIIDELVRRIQRTLPLAQVVVRAGGRPDSLFITIAMLIYSNVTFCSASTFCFHFATSKPEGKLYLPESSRLFYGRDLDSYFCILLVFSIISSYIPFHTFSNTLTLERVTIGVNQFNCCNNIIHTMKGAVPISDWRLPNGIKINAEEETATKSSNFISILSNKSYPFISRSSAFPIVNISTWVYPVAAPTASLAHQRRKRSFVRPLKSQSKLGQDYLLSGGQYSSIGGGPLGGPSTGGLSIFTIVGGTFAMVLLILFQCTLWRSIPTPPSHRSPYHQR